MPWQDSSVVEQRLRLVEALIAGGDFAATCRRFGISRQTGYKYLARFKKLGGAGLADQPRRPCQPHQPQADSWRKQVLQFRRRRPTWGARKLRWQLRQSEQRRRRLPSERTIQRWLQSAGLIKRRVGPRRSAPPERKRKGTIARRSNHVWSIDLKGWFTSADHKKIEPLTVRDQWSRFILYACHLSPRDERGVRRVCTRLFRRYGAPRIIRCDRGAPFFGDGPHGFSRLSLWWWRLGIRVEFVRRGYINNNAHEQMHRVLKAEASAPAPHLAAQNARLQRWRRDYNHCRPHEALRMRPPELVLSSPPRLVP